MERTGTGEFNWLDISAADLEAQSAFYVELFGWVRSDVPFGEGQIYALFYKDGHRVAGMTQLAPDLLAAGVPTAWNTYVATDDVDTTVTRAIELGGTIAMEPTDVPGSGRMACVQDPTGAYIFFWRADSPDDSMVYYEPGTQTWNDLNTRDPQKAKEFYSALLGWEFTSRGQASDDAMPYWQINVGGQAQAGMMPMPDMVPPQVPSFWMPYFGSTDVAADSAKAASLGATVLVEPTTVEDTVVFSVVTDPSGATFALMQYT